MTEGNHEKNPNPFGQHRDLSWKLFEYESCVRNFIRRYVLCIQKLYYRPHFGSTVGGSWNNSLLLQPLQRWYREQGCQVILLEIRNDFFKLAIGEKKSPNI